MQSALLRNGPMTRVAFNRLCQKTIQTLNLPCALTVIQFRNINLGEHPIQHNADRVAHEIAQIAELVNISDFVEKYGNGMTLTAFKTHVSQHPRLTQHIFIVPGQHWKGRKRTALNICDAQSLLRAVRLSGCRGLALLDLAPEYEGCGNDLKTFIEIKAIVQVINRVYCVSVAQPQVPGALKAWNQKWR